jgi:hypothetical protein
MTQQYSFPGPSGLTDQYAARKDLAGLVARNTSGVPRSGLLPRSLVIPVVTSRADMQVDVAAFEAIAVQYGGPIFLANDAIAQVAIAVAPPSNSRIDVVYVKQNENAAPATDADNSLQLASVTGQASASPVKPAIPNGAVEIATVLVPAGKTATNQSGVVITHTFQMTAMSGGVVACRNQTELQAWTPLDGSQAWSAADQALYLREQQVWVPQTPSIVPLIAGAGWTPAAAPNAPRAILLSGNVVIVYGYVAWAGGGNYSTMVTVPAALRPPTAGTRNIGVARETTGSSMVLFNAVLNQATGAIGNGTGGTGSLPATGGVTLDGLSWVMD